ncbi:MAG: cobalt-zinc-cadmium efflux system membrane fusion protein [Crocinitomicaceae bacterium]|jgi:cobalt-zinc-cadmium efflux system membrane fusion protein
MIKISTFLVAILLLMSCQENQEEVHDHENEELTQSHTIWTEKTELFVEYNPLIVGELSTFLAHFSELTHFKALEKGRVTVSLIKGETGIRTTVDAPSAPGIFKPSLKPTSPGIYTLVFEVNSGDLKDKITIEGVEVFASLASAKQKIVVAEENSNEIVFLKEQAWKMEFANAPVVKQELYTIVKCSGKILPSVGDEKTMIATTSGIVVFNSTGITIGSEVSANQRLFTVTGGNITDNNIRTQFQSAKASFQREKQNLARKKELYESDVIAKSAYENAVLSHDLAKNQYQNLAANYSRGGKAIRSTFTGYIKQLFKSEGQYVEAGEPLAVITKNKRLTLEAHVGQLNYHLLNETMTANFSYNGKTHSIEEYNGKLLSYGKALTEDHPKIPVYFELDNKSDLLPGSFIEVWIKTTKTSNALTVPLSALLENYGNYSVIVQLSGERFEKRNVIIGISDGQSVEIKSGLVEGERIVTTGAYQIKMVSMSGEVPEHGHAH